MREWLNNNWSSLLPIAASIVTAVCTAVIWKRQRKVEDKFSRSTSAYNIIMKKEFAFYEQADVIFAELIPCVHDIIDNLTNDPHPIKFKLAERKKYARENFLLFMEKAQEFRNLHLRYEIYLPGQICKASLEAVDTMYIAVEIINEELTKLFDQNGKHIKEKTCRETKEIIMQSFAIIRGFMINRIKEMSRV